VRDIKHRIAQRARRMQNRRSALRQIQFDIQNETKKFMEQQTGRLATVQERKLDCGTFVYRLRSCEGRNQRDDEEICEIENEIEMFVQAQKKKLDNLIEEERMVKQQIELEHQRDLKFCSKQIIEEYEDWEEKYASSEYDTDCFPPDDYFSDDEDEESPDDG
jgi:hypothetical protein